MDPVPIGTTSYGAHWLDRPAADAWFRMVRDGCPPQGITDAGRTNEEQVDVFLKYFTTDYASSAKHDARLWQGRMYWRRVGKPSAATPGSVQARHTYGRALDLNGSTKAWVRAHGRTYGWIPDLVKGEDWHMEYQPAADIVRVNNPGTSIGTVPTVPTLPELDPLTPKEANDMATWFPGYIVTYPGTTAQFLLSPDLATKRHLHSLDEVNVAAATGAIVTDDFGRTTIDNALWAGCHNVFAQA